MRSPVNRAERPVADALQLVHLYAERGSAKYEKAALRWLGCYLTEGAPRLERFAEVAGDLARHESQRVFVCEVED